MFWGIARVILTVLGGLLAIALVAIIWQFIYKTIKNKIKTKKKWGDVIKDTYYYKITDFIKWVSIDLASGKDYLRLYGIWAFTGYYGQGKTLGAVTYAKTLQKKYPYKNIKIYSNINVAGQNGKIDTWEQLLDLPPNSIFVFDESQSDFGSTNVGIRDFPPELLRKLTQVRKKQLAVFATSPVYTRMNINFRESCAFIIESKNLWDLDRLFIYDFYRAEEYDRIIENDEKRRKYRLFRESIIASNEVYGYYNTLESVETIKKTVSDSKKDTKKLKKGDAVNLDRVIEDLRNEFHKDLEQQVRMLKGEIRKL